jgi:(S)-ureidoglycine aminohydrolase
MTPLFGHTRTCLKPRHALITPDGHVAAALPGVEKVWLVAHITPAMGAGFAQLSLAFTEAGGVARFPANARQAVLYVTSGAVRCRAGAQSTQMEAGAFAYVSESDALEISFAGGPGMVTIFQKKYVPSPGVKPPASFFGLSSKIQGQPFLGNPKALLQATLPFVETHVMEHGLLMLTGQGVYRLEDSWYPVMAGDVIWMAPYCPQWFVAMGDEPASYLYYKDVNRPALP